MAESTSAKFDVVMYEYFATCKCPHRGAVEAVVLHWLRNKTLIKSAILAACRKRPKNAVFAVLKGAAAEAMSAESGKYAQTIHSWVEFSKRKLSKNESSFINAVLRKLETNIATLESGGEGRRTFFSESRPTRKRTPRSFLSKNFSKKRNTQISSS